MDGAVAGTAPPRTLSLGTMFVGPLFDYLLIGGLLGWAAGAGPYFRQLQLSRQRSLPLVGDPRVELGALRGLHRAALHEAGRREELARSHARLPGDCRSGGDRCPHRGRALRPIPLRPLPRLVALSLLAP